MISRDALASSSKRSIFSIYLLLLSYGSSSEKEWKEKLIFVWQFV